MSNVDKKYENIIDYLYNYLPHFTEKLGLSNITNLLNLLENPQNSYESIHVAGTNGKGSVCTILQTILTESGYKVGMLISPHLVDFRERITINGEWIEKEQVVALMKEMKPMIKKTGATFFETVTAMAFLHFARENVDYAVVEVGMGGRLDATNLIIPQVSVITNIGFDHMAKLGNTLEAIAGEKAGIIKEGVPVVLSPNEEEAYNRIAQECERKNAELIDICQIANWKVQKLTEEGTFFDLEILGRAYENLRFSLIGKHQATNATTAIATLLKLPDFELQEEKLREGLGKTKWRSRLEVIQKEPKILIDGAHNPPGVKTLCDALREIFHYNRLFLIFGVLEGKLKEQMIPQLAELADEFIATQPTIVDRKILSYKILAEEVKNYHEKVVPMANVREAINYAVKNAENDDLICIAGSLYMAGEAIEFLERNKEKS